MASALAACLVRANGVGINRQAESLTYFWIARTNRQAESLTYFSCILSGVVSILLTGWIEASMIDGFVVIPPIGVRR
jgi:hypothetical protein